jgi:nicotinamide-nucleotide amidase
MSVDRRPPSDAALAALARRLGDELLARGWRAATAESCTGGWIAKAITDVPGSSRWFGTGFVTYENEAKVRDLGVDGRVLAESGAVSEQVVRAMADAARRRVCADVSVAVSGIAGPDGGTPAKPVGTVWFAWASPGQLRAERCVFLGDREAVRRFAVKYALEGLIAGVTVPDIR